MEDFLKKYWPFLAAIAVLLYLLNVCENDRKALRKAGSAGGADDTGTAPVNTEPVTTTPEPQQPEPTGPTIPDDGCITHVAADGSTYVSCV